MDADNASTRDLEEEGSTASQDAQPPSLMGLPTELITEICQYLDPADIASLRKGSNSRISAIARPFLAPKTCNLYFSLHSARRMWKFVQDKGWACRIETVKNHIGDRANINHAVIQSQAEYIRPQDDNFSDEAHKKAMFEAYHKWRTTQDGEEVTELANSTVDFVILQAMKGLPNLKSFDMVIVPCTSRGFFPRDTRHQILQPHGFYELRDVVGLLVKYNVTTTCTDLRVLGVDNFVFRGHWWDPPDSGNKIPSITKIELLYADPYCRTTHLKWWFMPTMMDFLRFFPNLEDLTLGLNVCQESDCLGEFFLPPSVDHRHHRFVPLDDAKMDEIDFKIPKLRRLTLKNVRLNGDHIVKFVDNHADSFKERGVALELNLINFRLSLPEDKDFETLKTELVDLGVKLNVSAVDVLTGKEEKGKSFVYDPPTDVRVHTKYLLRRKNGKDYQASKKRGLCIRTQQGGVIGEDVVLDHWWE
ncbi:hypothetical protein V8F20_010435 [Naviculisporaceae sp. PSN 640]